MSLVIRTFLLVLTVALCGLLGFAQTGADNRPAFGRPEDENFRPMGIKETLEKMRIEKEKKDFDAMLTRGEEAVKISEEVKKSFTTSGTLSQNDLSKVAKVEKLVKKIRDELGGDGDDGDTSDNESGDAPAITSTGGAVQALKDKADALYDQLKQTTRFTISAAAIVSSNAVLRVARFLKLRQ